MPFDSALERSNHLSNTSNQLNMNQSGLFAHSTASINGSPFANHDDDDDDSDEFSTLNREHQEISEDEEKSKSMTQLISRTSFDEYSRTYVCLYYDASF
jgi:hypothetical protein